MCYTYSILTESDESVAHIQTPTDGRREKSGFRTGSNSSLQNSVPELEIVGSKCKIIPSPSSSKEEVKKSSVSRTSQTHKSPNASRSSSTVIQKHGSETLRKTKDSPNVRERPSKGKQPKRGISDSSVVENVKNKNSSIFKPSNVRERPSKEAKEKRPKRGTSDSSVVENVKNKRPSDVKQSSSTVAALTKREQKSSGTSTERLSSTFKLPQRSTAFRIPNSKDDKHLQSKTRSLAAQEHKSSPEIRLQTTLGRKSSNTASSSSARSARAKAASDVTPKNSYTRSSHSENAKKSKVSEDTEKTKGSYSTRSKRQEIAFVQKCSGQKSPDVTPAIISSSRDIKASNKAPRRSNSALPNPRQDNDDAEVHSLIYDDKQTLAPPESLCESDMMLHGHKSEDRTKSPSRKSPSGTKSDLLKSPSGSAFALSQQKTEGRTKFASSKVRSGTTSPLSRPPSGSKIVLSREKSEGRIESPSSKVHSGTNFGLSKSPFGSDIVPSPGKSKDRTKPASQVRSETTSSLSKSSSGCNIVLSPEKSKDRTKSASQVRSGTASSLSKSPSGSNIVNTYEKSKDRTKSASQVRSGTKSSLSRSPSGSDIVLSPEKFKDRTKSASEVLSETKSPSSKNSFGSGSVLSLKASDSRTRSAFPKSAHTLHGSTDSPCCAPPTKSEVEVRYHREKSASAKSRSGINEEFRNYASNDRGKSLSHEQHTDITHAC